jgi:hypothetical protein
VGSGAAAWGLLCAAFIFEALFWGKTFHVVFLKAKGTQLLLTQKYQSFPLSFGVFQNYYSSLPQFADGLCIPIIGTVASGISYLGATLVIMSFLLQNGFRNIKDK